MTLYSTLSLALLMMALAAIPSTSVMLVIARTTGLNIVNGLAAIAGIIAGDLIYVLLAVLGLTALSHLPDSVFIAFRYIAAAYLAWLGLSAMMNAFSSNCYQTSISQGGLTTSFLSALTLTLADIKAILFYTGLLPAFVNLHSLHEADIAILIGVTVISIGSVKTVYVLLAARLTARTSSRFFPLALQIIIGLTLIAASGYLLLKPDLHS